MKIPLKDGTDHVIDTLELRMLCDAYPKIDVHAELRKMAEWCRANPQRRKTARGVKRFINSWLSRTPEKREQKVSYAAAHKPFEKEGPKVMTQEGGQRGLAMLKEAMRK